MPKSAHMLLSCWIYPWAMQDANQTFEAEEMVAGRQDDRSFGMEERLVSWLICVHFCWFWSLVTVGEVLFTPGLSPIPAPMMSNGHLNFIKIRNVLQLPHYQSQSCQHWYAHRFGDRPFQRDIYNVARPMPKSAHMLLSCWIYPWAMQDANQTFEAEEMVAGRQDDRSFGMEERLVSWLICVHFCWFWSLVTVGEVLFTPGLSPIPAPMMSNGHLNFL